MIDAKINILLIVVLILGSVFSSICFGANTPLSISVVKKDLEEVNRLLDSGVDVNEKDKHGFTALMFATSRGYVDIVKALIKRGANVHLVDKYGKSALDITSEWPDPTLHYKEIVIILQEAAYDDSDSVTTLPGAANNLYIVYSKGNISTTKNQTVDYKGVVKSREVVTSELGGGVSRTQGEYISKVRYEKDIKRLYLSTKLNVRDDSKSNRFLKRCLPLYSDWNSFKLVPSSADSKASYWYLESEDQKGVCVYPTIDLGTCGTIGCLKYERSNIYVTDSLESAMYLSKINKQKKSMTKSEIYKEMDRLSGRSSEEGEYEYQGMESYEAFGSCGAVSCMQQNIDFSMEW